MNISKEKSNTCVYNNKIATLGKLKPNVDTYKIYTGFIKYI